MHDDSASVQDLAALHAAVLRHHDEFLRMMPKPRRLRMARRPKRLHLSWLLIPWYLVVAARFFLPAFRGGLVDGEQRAARLYRRLSGKDPQVARAEVMRIGMQLRMLDKRFHEHDERPGTPLGADPGELEMATEALVGFYLAGRRTDDELLAQVEVPWAEYAVEDLQQFVHDNFVDTSWPPCPRHPNHPMWLAEGEGGGSVWRCLSDHAEVAPLGMLPESAQRPSRHP